MPRIARVIVPGMPHHVTQRGNMRANVFHSDRDRKFLRWRVRYDVDGRAGLQDRRLGRGSARAVPVDEALQMVRLYETRYTGWTVKHFHEHWCLAHGGTRSCSWTKKTLQAAGHVARAPRRGAHRKKTASQTVARHDVASRRVHP